MKKKDKIIIIPINNPEKIYRTEILKIDNEYLFLRFKDDFILNTNDSVLLKFSSNGSMQETEAVVKKISIEKKYFVIKLPEDKSADRAFARVETSIFCEFEIWGNFGNFHSGNIIDLSGNGLVLLSETEVKNKDLIRIVDIKDPNKNFHINSLVGRVVKFKPTVLEGFNNEIIINYINIKKSNQDQIVKYVNELIRENR